MSVNELEIEYTSITTVKSCQWKAETSFEDLIGKCWREDREQRLLFEATSEQLDRQHRTQITLRSEQLETPTLAWTAQEEKLIAKFANNFESEQLRLGRNHRAFGR